MIDISTAIATLKAIGGIAKDAGRIDLYNDVIGLQQTLLEVLGDNTKKVEEISRLSLEAVNLRERVAVLERQMSQRDEMTFDKNAYWRATASGSHEGPFCARCLDGSGKSSRMIDRPDDHWWRCSVCDATIEKPGADPGRYRSQVDGDPYDY